MSASEYKNGCAPRKKRRTCDREEEADRAACDRNADLGLRCHQIPAVSGPVPPRAPPVVTPLLVRPDGPSLAPRRAIAQENPSRAVRSAAHAVPTPSPSVATTSPRLRPTETTQPVGRHTLAIAADAEHHGAPPPCARYPELPPEIWYAVLVCWQDGLIRSGVRPRWRDRARLSLVCRAWQSLVWSLPGVRSRDCEGVPPEFVRLIGRRYAAAHRLRVTLPDGSVVSPAAPDVVIGLAIEIPGREQDLASGSPPNRRVAASAGLLCDAEDGVPLPSLARLRLAGMHNALDSHRGLAALLALTSLTRLELRAMGRLPTRALMSLAALPELEAMEVVGCLPYAPRSGERPPTTDGDDGGRPAGKEADPPRRGSRGHLSSTPTPTTIATIASGVRSLRVSETELSLALALAPSLTSLAVETRLTVPDALPCPDLSALSRLSGLAEFRVERLAGADGTLLTAVRGMSSLVRLHLSSRRPPGRGGGISDAGVAAIVAAAPSLEEVALLGWPDITDDGLRSLAALPALRALSLRVGPRASGSPLAAGALACCEPGRARRARTEGAEEEEREDGGWRDEKGDGKGRHRAPRPSLRFCCQHISDGCDLVWIALLTGVRSLDLPCVPPPARKRVLRCLPALSQLRSLALDFLPTREVLNALTRLERLSTVLRGTWSDAHGDDPSGGAPAALAFAGPLCPSLLRLEFQPSSRRIGLRDVTALPEAFPALSDLDAPSWEAGSEAEVRRWARSVPSLASVRWAGGLVRV